MTGLADRAGRLADGLTVDGPGGSRGWRPTTVAVMVVLPDGSFDWYDDDNTLSVLFSVLSHEGASPAGPTDSSSGCERQARRPQRAQVTTSTRRVVPAEPSSPTQKDMACCCATRSLSPSRRRKGTEMSPV